MSVSIAGFSQQCRNEEKSGKLASITYHCLIFTDENPRTQSYKTLVWGALVRIIGGAHPRLYSYQNSLPRMPVPALQDTCQGFLKSVKHILPEKEYKEMEELAKVILQD